MSASHRRQRIRVEKRARVNDGRHGYTYEHSYFTTIWGAISPTLGGGRRERQLFGPTIEFEMNAMGIFHPSADLQVTDLIKYRDDEYEVLAVVNSMYLDRRKFAALKSKPEVPGAPITP